MTPELDIVGLKPKRKQRLEFFDYAPMRDGQAVANLGVRGQARKVIVFTHKPSAFRVVVPHDDVSDASSFNALRNVVQETITVERPAGISWADSKAEVGGWDTARIGANLAEALFEYLADSWIDQTQYDSSLDTVFGHQAVGLIEGLGRPAFPLALR